MKGRTITQADAVGKMHVALPLLESLAARQYLCNLLADYAIQATAKAGAPLLVPKGTQVFQVSNNRLMVEHKVLEQGDPHRPEKLKKKLAEMCISWWTAAKRDGRDDKAPAAKQDQASYIHQCVDSALQLLVHLITLEDTDSAAAEEVGCVFSSCKPAPHASPSQS